MPRHPSPMLTDGELRLMRVLWQKGEASVGDVIGGLQERRKPAYNTVLTMLRILERKGQVMHRKEGRAFVFRPLVDRGGAQHSAMKYLVSRFFDGSPDLLVLNVLEDEDTPADVLSALKKRIAEAE
jgi:BlaI family transcriptional regulator, penicillinase repressor